MVTYVLLSSRVIFVMPRVPFQRIGMPQELGSPRFPSVAERCYPAKEKGDISTRKSNDHNAPAWLKPIDNETEDLYYAQLINAFAFRRVGKSSESVVTLLTCPFSEQATLDRPLFRTLPPSTCTPCS